MRVVGGLQYLLSLVRAFQNGVGEVSGICSSRDIVQKTNQEKIKIKKGVLANIVSIFDLLSENVIALVRMWLYLEIENILNLRKNICFRKRGCLYISNCAEIFHATNCAILNSLNAIYR